jgi:formylglycine-generating enzyme required for sulfatase activity
MHGNVWEWVRDWYGEYIPGVEVNPVGPTSGKCSRVDTDQKTVTFDNSVACRVARGGSFVDPPEFLRSANRENFHREYRPEDGGFRCVRVPPALGR